MFRAVPQLTVSDLERSIAFYVGLLDFTVTLRDPADAPVFVTLERDDAMLFLVSESSREDTDAAEDLAAHKHGVGVRLYFEVDDARAVYERVPATGARLHRDLTYNADENYTEFVVLDPEGYEIGVYS